MNRCVRACRGRGSVWFLVILAAAVGLYVWGRFWRVGGAPGSDGVGDAMRYYLPNLIYSGTHLLRGELPLWNPFEMLGMPMFATLEYGPLYPPNWLYLFLPVRAAHIAVGALHMCFFAWFTFAYLRRVLRLDGAMAAYGGCVAAFSQWSVLHLCAVPDTYHGAVWIPLVLLCAELLLERPRAAGALWLGVVLCVQFLAGEPEISVRTGLMLAVYVPFRAGIRLYRERNWPWAGRVAAWCGAAGILALALAAVQWIPTAELSMYSVRKPGALSFTAAFRGGWGTHLELLRKLVSASGDPHCLFVGLPALAFAVYAIVRPRADTVFFLLSGAISLELLRGDASPVAYLYYRFVPTGDWFQAPIRFAPYLLIPIAILAAQGMQRLAEDVVDGRAWPAVVLFGVLGIAGAWFCGRVWDGFATASAMAVFVIIALLIVCAKTWGHFRHGARSRWIGPVLAGLGAFGLFTVAELTYPVADYNIPETPHFTGLSPDIEGFLREHATNGQRVYADYALEEGRRVPKLGPLLEVACVDGQSPFMPGGYWKAFKPYLDARFKADAEEEGAAPAVGLSGGLALQRGAGDFMNLLGVRYLVLGLGNLFFGPPAFDWLARLAVPPEFRVVMQRGQIAVLENLGAWPRAFVLTRDMAEPPHTGAPVAGIVAARIVEYRAGEVIIQPPAGAAGLLVLTDQYFAGWHASVDGEARPIEKVWERFRGIRVRGGDREVVLRYLPASVYWGAGISGSGICIVLAVWAMMAFAARGAKASMPDRAGRPGDDGITGRVL